LESEGSSAVTAWSPDGKYLAAVNDEKLTLTNGLYNIGPTPAAHKCRHDFHSDFAVGIAVANREISVKLAIECGLCSIRLFGSLGRL